MTIVDNTRAKLKIIAARIDSLQFRQRALIFVAIMASLYVLADGFVFSPLLSEKDRMQPQLKAKLQQIIALNKQTQEILAGPDGQVNSGKQKRLEKLRKQLASLRSDVEKITTDLVSPKDMVGLVEDVLIKNHRLKVIELVNLPPKPIANASDRKEAGDKAEAMGPVVYNHGMRVQLSGRYQDIVSYLQALESLPWKVFWGQVTLESENYPRSQLTLVLFTLSLSEGWIGT